MKAKVIALDGKDAREIELPAVFDTPYRPEVIQKVYVNLVSHSYQIQGRYPAAGEMVSAESRNTGLGIARLARARGEGFPRAGQGAGVAGVRHGRAAHPPHAWRIIHKKINHKERQLGLCSAIAATTRKELVQRRGHNIGDDMKLPIVVSNDIELIAKTKDLKNTLVRLGLGSDIARASIARKSRSGTARRRGRSTQSGISALIIVGNRSNKLVMLSRSIPGVEVKHVKDVSVTDLVPGSKPIRLTIFSENAIEGMRSLQAPMHKVLQVIRK